MRGKRPCLQRLSFIRMPTPAGSTPFIRFWEMPYPLAPRSPDDPHRAPVPGLLSPFHLSDVEGPMPTRDGCSRLFPLMSFAIFGARAPGRLDWRVHSLPSSSAAWPAVPSPFVIRRPRVTARGRLDRRIQREGKTTPSAGVGPPADWVRRSSRRTTRKGKRHPPSPSSFRHLPPRLPSLPPFVIRRLDRRIQREAGRVPGAGDGSHVGWIRRSSAANDAKGGGGSSRKERQPQAPGLVRLPDGFAGQAGERRFGDQ